MRICHYNSLRGIILDSNNELFKIDISDYVKFIIYDVDINPTLTFIPESIYKEIEDRILKAEVAREKEIVEEENVIDESETIAEENIEQSLELKREN